MSDVCLNKKKRKYSVFVLDVKKTSENPEDVENLVFTPKWWWFMG